ncbi:hypothetical protein BB560_002827, partial [Smittium megazygosporum]
MEIIDATFTFKALALESNIFQKRIHRKRLIFALEKLVYSLKDTKINLEKDNESATWIYGPQPSNQEFVSDNLNPTIKKKAENLARNVVQDTSSNTMLAERMDNFIETQMAYINESNNQEFLSVAKGRTFSSARVNPNQINRGIQIQRDVVDNSEYFKTTYRDTSAKPTFGDPKPINKLFGLDERLGNIETHLNKFSVYDRVSTLEQRLMQIERDFPQIAKMNFIQPGLKNPNEKRTQTSVKKKSGLIIAEFPNIFSKNKATENTNITVESSKSESVNRITAICPKNAYFGLSASNFKKLKTRTGRSSQGQLRYLKSKLKKYNSLTSAIAEI